MVGGAISHAREGNLGHGFWAAGLNQAIGGTDMTSNPVANVAILAVIGGTISKVTGGKFANGAVSAAFAAALRQDWSSNKQLFRRNAPSQGPNQGLPKEIKESISNAINDKEYQKAAELAADYLNIDISKAKSFIANYNTVGAAGGVDLFGNVGIYRAAFSSPEQLISTVGHEFVHIGQWLEGHANVDPNTQQHALNEVEAYQWEIDNVSITGNTSGLTYMNKQYNFYYNQVYISTALGGGMGIG